MTRSGVLVAGLMSGTSLDGITAVLLEVTGSDPAALGVKLEGLVETPYDTDFRARLAQGVRGAPLRELAALHRELGLRFAGALKTLLDGAGVPARSVSAVGSHGQTFRHDPPGEGTPGATLQLGCAATLAEESGISVASDFRSRDVAAGGHGAPLVPWADWVLLRKPGTGRALQNLGGMGNVTFLPRSGELSDVRAFDTGPGVALLDGVVRRATAGREAWDEGGGRAARGRADPALLGHLLADSFFSETPPRSTGRERFGDERVEALVREASPDSDAAWDDLLATLVELTARSVAVSYAEHLPRQEIDEVVLTGGGARNATLVRAIEGALDPIPVRTGGRALGIDPAAREAAAFALMAWAHERRIPAGLPGVTGARGARILGSWTPGASE
jgi:anhydro-N-acetylmuramic acid kinase